MTINSVTLHRSEPVDYQLTLWADGIARWDGEKGVTRTGAWQALVPAAWPRNLAGILDLLPPPARPSSVAPVTVVIDDGGTIRRHSGDPATAGVGLWTIITLLEGIAAQAQWEPIGAPLPPPGTHLVGYRVRDIAATAHWSPAGSTTTVLAGSGASCAEAPSLTREYRRKRQELLDDGTLALDGDRLIFTTDHAFTSPSAAATIVAGSNTNGRTAWRTDDGTPISRLQ